MRSLSPTTKDFLPLTIATGVLPGSAQKLNLFHYQQLSAALFELLLLKSSHQQIYNWKCSLLNPFQLANNTVRILINSSYIDRETSDSETHRKFTIFGQVNTICGGCFLEGWWNLSRLSFLLCTILFHDDLPKFETKSLPRKCLKPSEHFNQAIAIWLWR